MCLSSLHLLVRCTGAVLVTGFLSSAQAEAGALSQLYAARPPAGSSYVRVVNPAMSQLHVQIAQGLAQRLGGVAAAGSYAIVEGGRAFAVQVDGAVAARLDVRPDSFTTFVMAKVATGYSFTPIDDTTDTEDALKAELRFYNLVAGCPTAKLTLSPDGPVVFADVAAGRSATRSVNPVRANLSGMCGSAVSAPVALPEMQSGDHVSLFLTGSAKTPVLVVQPNRTDAFKR